MTWANLTDRDKLGTKHHVLTDGHGIPLSAVITAANTHDIKAAISTLDNIVVNRSFSNNYRMKQNLCVDKGSDLHEIEDEVIKKGYLGYFETEIKSISPILVKMSPVIFAEMQYEYYMWLWKSVGRGETLRIYFNIISVISGGTIKSKSFS